MVVHDSSSNVSESSFSSCTDDGGSNVDEQRDEVAELMKLSKRETTNITVFRRIVVCGLIATGIIVVTASSRYLQRGQNGAFVQAFAQFAGSLAANLIEQRERQVEASRTLATAVSIDAKSSGESWPEVTMTDFHVVADSQTKDAGIFWMSLLVIVKEEERESYLDYTSTHFKKWVTDGLHRFVGELDKNITTPPNMFFGFGSDGIVARENEESYLPLWQRWPPSYDNQHLNIDIFSIPVGAGPSRAAIALKNETTLARAEPHVADAETIKIHNDFHANKDGTVFDHHPHSWHYTPVFRDLGDPDTDVVATISTLVAWDTAFRRLLPDAVRGVIAVTKNTCDQTWTYRVDGSDAFFLGDGDLHDGKYDSMAVNVDLGSSTSERFLSEPGHCVYRVSFYPSDEFRSIYVGNAPYVIGTVLTITFSLIVVFFLVYDWWVRRRNNKLMQSAAQSSAIVTSMFPGDLRQQMIDEQKQSEERKSASPLSQLRSLDLGCDDGINGLIESSVSTANPIASLVVDTTVLFADITGFTSWSSVRAPAMVFSLLEKIFRAFDVAATKHGVFKVETVGDCYVAVCGFPKPQADHAIRMCKFARVIRKVFKRMVNSFDRTLGPGTSNLSLRVGIHSGPVTAGVMRGLRSRLQLFGQTMNFCSRIEATCERGKMHLSSETAGLLQQAGHVHWVKMRPDLVDLKGIGSYQTYWLSNTTGTHSETSSMASSTGACDSDDICVLEGRLVSWLVGVLVPVLEQIAARRATNTKKQCTSESIAAVENELRSEKSFLTEVKEVIVLPDFAQSTSVDEATKAAKIPNEDQVLSELNSFVSCIATMYRRNPFHSFEHAGHVCMSVVKLMSRIVAPTHLESKGGGNKSEELQLHDHTYGITSDPLTQLACILSALIHDADHPGVGNPQLAKENPRLGESYNNRSIAEQNSLSISWNLLMEPQYSNLRAAIYDSPEELRRFRALLVNAVMATDIMDNGLKELRNGRWDKAFKEAGDVTETSTEASISRNRKATIVIEHLIQASDVAHTMQHWEVYRKWNERLFEEMYTAFRLGRSDKNPADFWAKGEIGFFDFYIIPLTKKLKSCGVFGISSDEYLNYALSNRRDWVMKGEEVVAEMLEKLEAKDWFAVAAEAEVDQAGFGLELGDPSMSTGEDSVYSF